MPKISPKGPLQAEPARIVKTLLPVTLIREMDQAILANASSYMGRDEFIAEAIRDRIAEDRANAVSGSTATVVLLDEIRTTNEFAKINSLAAPPPKVATLPVVEVSDELYGLHNRDYPTLWAAASLASMVGAAGGPISWSDFRMTMLEAAWNLGAKLARLDVERSRGTMKAAIGFPVNREKRESAESRFGEHLLGTVRGDGTPHGPLFVLALAGIAMSSHVDDGVTEPDLLVAPSPAGRDLVAMLANTPFSPQPPHPEGAWRAFSSHLERHAHRDYSSWMDVLEAVATGVPRADLSDRFQRRWPASAAATNVYGYLSRSREWGLLEPQLRNGEYEVTDRGLKALREAGRP